MGQISYEQATEVMSSFSKDTPQVGFLTLKNDGDEAIVRFMHDSTESFDILTVHPMRVDGKFGKYSCIRDARDPLDKCPLCKNGTKLENRIYIHLIHYVKDENGNIVAVPKVWERSLVYAKELAGLINEYGPLSDCIFKIKRNGAVKSMDTTYQIMYASPQVYRPELYPKMPELFEGYKALGRAVIDKTFDELSEFVSTGSFPTKQSSETSNITPSYIPPTTNAAPAQDWTGGYANQTVTPYPSQQPYPNPQFTPVQQTQTLAPWETNSPVMQRPVRKY